MAYGRGHIRYDENKRAVDREIYGPGRQDDHDPLHPVHALRPLRRGGRRASRRSARSCRGEDMQITSYLEQARDDASCRGNVVDLCPVGALVSKPYSFEARPWELRKVPGDRRHGRGRHQHPPRRRGARGDARAAAHQRGRQRGVGAATRPATRSTGCVRNRLDRPWVRERRQAAAGELGRGVRGDRQGGEGGRGQASRRSPATCVDVETMYAAKALLAALGSDLLEGRQTGLDLRRVEPRRGQFQLDHRRHRDGRRDPAGRHQPALGSAAGQHPHPQGGEGGRQGVRDRARRSISTYPVEWLGDDLSLLGKLPEAVARGVRKARAAGGDRRRRGAEGARAGRRRRLALVDSLEPRPRRLERLQRPPHRAPRGWAG